ncbi:calcium-dependent phosphotriesterase [Coemansia reversa NRRL 1564]|uniref:Calcium-dependent phosphotriesterase n=1 Tax=Coemansia reversa (strain ATCC 12441 / NRRL 1564) TaxID=763665 RepID=A0A2G5BEE6_COERN|nr:calcium-dependent phosphotriesterase [Coemansia reversa NRRL 1564]|eukprot:PIA17385.1 calcium-dependent phosphotriesterase [Coemansia reversa NRRL 1564]
MCTMHAVYGILLLAFTVINEAAAAAAAAAAGPGILNTIQPDPESVPLFRALPYMTAENTTFGGLIEGAAVDHYGNFYAANYNAFKGEVGRAFRRPELFFRNRVDDGSWFNAIRFGTDRDGVQEAYIGDVVNHRVVRVRDPGSKRTFFHSETFCYHPNMLQPNDLAIAYSTRRLFLSGMRFSNNSAIGDGDLWTCDERGAARRLAIFHRTNGVEVSPDEKTLYISEAVNEDGNVVSNVIYAFDLDAQRGNIGNKRTLVDFGQLDGSASHDIDGMRTDANGDLYVTRWGAGRVAKLSATGQLLAYIGLASINEATNLEFAGPTGRELFIVGACMSDPTKGCIDRWTGPVQGHAFASLQQAYTKE